MDEAASKIQKQFREKQARSKGKEEVVQEKGYDREQEKNQEIGEEFLKPTQEMDEAASKIQK